MPLHCFNLIKASDILRSPEDTISPITRVPSNPWFISLLTACVVSAEYNVIRSSGSEFESPRRPFVPRLRGYPHPYEQTFTLLQRSPRWGDHQPSQRACRSRHGRTEISSCVSRGAPYAGLDGCYRAPSTENLALGVPLTPPCPRLPTPGNRVAFCLVRTPL
ncbi:hypothetical protein HN011_005931 [Eciton burchellii]|nr:hypothetical protein HN011_005931 [Eciton burchellii]